MVYLHSVHLFGHIHNYYVVMILNYTPVNESPLLSLLILIILKMIITELSLLKFNIKKHIVFVFILDLQYIERMFPS